MATILSLDDSCLERIVKYLPLEDALHFAHVCRRFHKIWENILLQLTVSIGSNMNMVQKEVQFFLTFGHYLKTIKINCENLNTYLWVHEQEVMTNFIYRRACLAMDQHSALEHLDVEMPYLDKSPAARFLRAIATGIVHSPRLTTLTVDAGALTVFTQLYYLEQVVVLNGPISFRDFYTLCSYNTNLRLLEFDAGDHHFDLSVLWDNCTNLEVLKIGGTNIKDYNTLAQLPNLKQLIFTSGCASKMLPLIKSLNSNNFRMLQHLELHCTISKEIIEHIAELTALTVLRIPHVNGWSNIGVLSKLTKLEVFETSIPSFENPSGIMEILKACTKLRSLQINVPSKLTYIFSFIPEIFGILFVVRNPKEQQKLQLNLIFDCAAQVIDDIDFVLTSEWSSRYAPFLAVEVKAKANQWVHINGNQQLD